MSGAPRWRPNWKDSDVEIAKLSASAKPGDKVYFDPGPGVRCVGKFKDWDSEGVAIVELYEDRPGFGPDVKAYHPGKVMKVPLVAHA